MKTARTQSELPTQLSALADDARLRICRLLEREELSVGEVARVLQMAQSTISRHLKVLTQAGWIFKRAEGTATLYRFVLDDLPESPRHVWSALRPNIEQDPHAQDDERRLRAVLADRTPDSRSFFSRMGGDWDHVRRELFGSGFTGHALLSMLPPEWRVVDFGSGTGNAGELLAPFVREVTLVDISEPMLEAARGQLIERDNVRFVCADAAATPLEPASFDAATCVLVLHHVPAPELVVREMARVVRPGGLVVVIEMVAHDRDEYRHTMGHHHLGFDTDELTALLDAAGLDTRRIERLPSAPDARGPDLQVGVGVVRETKQHCDGGA